MKEIGMRLFFVTGLMGIGSLCAWAQSADDWKAEAAADSKAGNLTKMVQDYQQGADLGDKSAEDLLASCLRTGRGAAKSYPRAFYWYEKSANLGNSDAAYYLGVFYENGWVIPKELDEAKVWYQKAADLGNAKGKAALARLAVKP